MTGPRVTACVDVVALRAEPGRANERVSEALLGEPLDVIESVERGGDPWLRVAGADGYPGWVPGRATVAYAPPERPRLIHTRFAVVRGEGDACRVVSLGCIVDALGDAAGERVRLPDGLEGSLDTAGACSFYTDSSENDLRAFLDRARAWLGVPYRWGGRSVSGVDCSGFMQRLLATRGVVLPRDSRQQEAFAARSMRRVDRAEVEAGDWLFWGRERASHVGIALDRDHFIHAREWVRVGHWEGPDADLASLFRAAYRPTSSTSR